MFPNEPDTENLDNSIGEEKIENPAEDQTHRKRNSGKTGPKNTSRSSRNAIRHGMCATTLLLSYEKEEDWDELFTSWLAQYNNPEEKTVLYTFVIKTAQAEWIRLRIQHQYDMHCLHHGAPPVTGWSDTEIKQHDLVQRYLTAAERKFQREYKMLEYHFKTHHKPAPDLQASKKKTPTEPTAPAEPEDKPAHRIRYVNLKTGESVDAFGNRFPAPPDWTPKKIIPGVYPPNHPAYQGPPE
jgi:hypothetical protein